MSFNSFKSEVSKSIIAKHIIDDNLLCYAYGTDASMYRMVPKLVIIVENQQEVANILKLANLFNIKLTFRAAGTSLSGQALTNQVLVVLSNRSWQKYSIINNGQQIKLEPGIIGSYANHLLKLYNKKIGPDPASINACKIGGIVANNSSGMCCGVLNNTYHTLAGMKFLLADGTLLDSGDILSRQRFLATHSHMLSQIKQIKEQICKDVDLVELIKYKFRLKNTTGYSINAFLDFDDPIDILTHLLVGSEGTLGFISEVTYNCVNNNKFKQVSLIYLDDIYEVVNLTLKLTNQIIDAMELLDISSLNSIKNIEQFQEYLPILGDNTAAVLIEVSSHDEAILEELVMQIQSIIDMNKVYYQIPFTHDEAIINAIWNLRKGIFPTIGASRPSGTSVIIEDIAVDIEKLPLIISELRLLFVKFAYHNAAIFGHILAGNIHFVFTPNLSNVDEVLIYKAFMEAMTKLVAVKFRGSLKAEHGCGRNMAPFVELEWGSKAYKIMWQIKRLLDPNNILNPDVILSNNIQIHLENLKQINIIDSSVDSCMECGFCENVCPSKNLTLTPRQRITVYRYLQKLKQEGSFLYNKLAKKFDYYGVKTCATTGLCASSCPVNINTGDFILKLKQSSVGYMTILLRRYFRRFIYFSNISIRLVNYFAKIIGSRNLYTLTKKIHKIFPIIPVYLPNTDNSNIIYSDTFKENRGHILYIPSCSTRIFDNGKNNFNVRLLRRLGYQLLFLDNFENLCCGQIFASKGNGDFSIDKVQELYKSIDSVEKYSYSNIIIDNSSCYYHILKDISCNDIKHQLPINDMLSFIANNLDKFDLQQKYNKIALHIDCSSKKNISDLQIMKILTRCSKEIIIPTGITCCGFAGIKGFNVPELNEGALFSLKEQIVGCEVGVTFNRNCQIGLSFYGKCRYISLAELVYSCLS